ncbi:unnamed protein product [Strongylus vulgaris]|uniref:Uncharacterized protein n=1 Tax=Strongylus vulgaris TaxID=40348 RepID=A0A3P7K8L6_STRVU|nr:unnamed protein product [Strongylus vulgaris]
MIVAMHLDMSPLSNVLNVVGIPESLQKDYLLITVYEVGCFMQVIDLVFFAFLPDEDLVAIMSETTTATNRNSDDIVSEERGSVLKCLACHDVITKGMYMICRTCASEEQKAAGRASVLKAKRQGLLAIDRAIAGFDSGTTSARDLLKEKAYDILHQIEIIDEQLDTVSSYDAFQSKIEQARGISVGLQRFSSEVDNILNEFRDSIYAKMNDVMGSAFDDVDKNQKKTPMGLVNSFFGRFWNVYICKPLQTRTGIGRIWAFFREICIRCANFCDAVLKNLSQFLTSILALTVNCFRSRPTTTQRCL